MIVSMSETLSVEPSYENRVKIFSPPPRLPPPVLSLVKKQACFAIKEICVVVLDRGPGCERIAMAARRRPAVE